MENENTIGSDLVFGYSVVDHKSPNDALQASRRASLQYATTLQPVPRNRVGISAFSCAASCSNLTMEKEEDEGQRRTAQQTFSLKVCTRCLPIPQGSQLYSQRGAVRDLLHIFIVALDVWSTWFSETFWIRVDDKVLPFLQVVPEEHYP